MRIKFCLSVFIAILSASMNASANGYNASTMWGTSPGVSVPGAAQSAYKHRQNEGSGIKIVNRSSNNTHIHNTFIHVHEGEEEEGE